MEDIANPNAFLVRPKRGGWESYLPYLLSYLGDYDIGSDHKLYVSRRFLLGNFEKQKENFVLMPGGIFYRDSPKVLERCQRNLEGGRLEVVKSLLLPEEILETIVQQKKEYVSARKMLTDAKKQMSKSAESLCQFLS